MSLSKAISHQVEMQPQGLSWSQAVGCSCDLLSSAVSMYVEGIPKERYCNFCSFASRQPLPVLSVLPALWCQSSRLSLWDSGCLLSRPTNATSPYQSQIVPTFSCLRPASTPVQPVQPAQPMQPMQPMQPSSGILRSCKVAQRVMFCRNFLHDHGILTS